VYLIDRLKNRGWTVDIIRIHSYVKREGRLDSLILKMGEADLLVFSFPLYVDSMPAPVIRVLEALAETLNRLRADGEPVKTQGFAAIVNNGFPEVLHNHTALAQARIFSRQAGLIWMGGLAMGMGEAVGGQPLAERGAMVRNVRRALDTAAEALTNGSRIPDEAAQLMGRKLIPRWLYLLIGNRGWKKRAAKHGVEAELRDRPLTD
jgi:multimeric flavodoxin WrbA